MQALQLPFPAWVPPAPAADPDGLRSYQREAYEAIRCELAARHSTLAVMATGLGKTVLAASVMKHWPGRVGFFAHRDEILQQTCRTLERLTGEAVDLEQAAFRSSGARIVVGSVQTLSRPTRLRRFEPDHFSLIVIDECHHAVAATYLRILERFQGARVLGLTATPDRTDAVGLKKVFESCAFERGIDFGIDEGYLTPVLMRAVHVSAIDLTKVRVRCGDLALDDLDYVMRAEEALHGVAKPTLDLAGDRKTLVYTTSVENAHRLAEIFNRYRPGSAQALDGKTDKDERREMLAAHRRGDFQFLCNMNVLTEGYDDPSVSCIAMARPTKSRSLYVQALGRGLRVLEGIGELPSSDERRAAIAASAKPDCLVLDYVGNCGKHQLVCAADVLGEELDEATSKKVRTIVQREAMRYEDALDQAKAELERERLEAAEVARRAQLTAQVEYRVADIDAFGVLHTKNPGMQGEVASGKQLLCLAKYGVDIPHNCTKKQASQLINNVIARSQRGLATYKQLRHLARYGITTLNISIGTASDLIDDIRRHGPPTPARVNAIIGGGKRCS